MRIISLLPSATEILYSIGAGDQIVGISHECDYPKEARKKAIVTQTIIGIDDSSNKIDQVVSRSIKNGQSIYKVDQELIVELKPDLIITQKLCEVCAITPTDLQKAIRECNPTPNIISLHPHSIKEILEDIKTVGKAVNKEKEAQKLVKSLYQRINKIKNLTKNIKKRPKIYCMEWLDPPYNAGHWVPEQVEIAGGRDDIATKGIDSVRLLWQEIVDYNPDIMVLMPCGFSINRTKKEIKILTQNPEWSKLQCVKNKQVFLVNGPAYFNCSGPRIVKGIELLTKITHSHLFTKEFTRSDFQQL
jgi:iron complex transport system substrate-binding protein